MEFKADIRYTLEDMQEFQHFHGRHRTRGLFLVQTGVYVLAALFALVMLIVLWRRGDLAYCFAYGFLLVFLAATRVSRAIKVRAAVREQWQNSRRSQIVFGEDEYVTSGEHGGGHADYSAFQIVYHWKDYWYFYRDKTHALIVPARCLTEGDPAAFSGFLREHCGLTVKEFN